MPHYYKPLILAVAAFLYSFSAGAQIKLGVKGGGGVAGIHQEPEMFDAASRYAYHIGLFTQVTRYKSRFFVRPELLYSSRGFHMKGAGMDRLITLNYFSIPIMFGFKPGKKLAMLAGIEPAFMTGFTAHFVNNYRTNDIALNAGISYDITYNLGIELRGGIGLLSLMEVVHTNEQGQETRTEAGYNNALQLSVSYNFAKEGLSNIAPVLRRKKSPATAE